MSFFFENNKEDGLDELIELEKKKEEQSFLFEADNDDAKSSKEYRLFATIVVMLRRFVLNQWKDIDLREFERKLKSSRSTRKKNDSSSSEDDDFEGL